MTINQKLNQILTNANGEWVDEFEWQGQIDCKDSIKHLNFTITKIEYHNGWWGFIAHTIDMSTGEVIPEYFNIVEVGDTYIMTNDIYDIVFELDI